MQFGMLNWPLGATKGQIRDGSLLQIDLYDVYKLRAKFHAFIKKCIKMLRSSNLNANCEQDLMYWLFY